MVQPVCTIHRRFIQIHRLLKTFIKYFCINVVNTSNTNKFIYSLFLLVLGWPLDTIVINNGLLRILMRYYGFPYRLM
jgi:hypothetical protein